MHESQRDPGRESAVDPVTARRARRDARVRREHRRGRVAQAGFLALVAVSVLGTSALAAPVAGLEDALAALMHAASTFLG